MTLDRRLVIYEEPAEPQQPQLALSPNGTLELAMGGRYPAGKLPTGQWLSVNAPHVAGDALAKLSPYFVERAEYNVTNGQTRLEPWGSDPFDMSIKQG